jgi:glycosyltransferase involved in cell wall biosynthesis
LATRKLRCLQLIEELDFKQGGVTRAVLDLSLALQNSGVNTTLATYSEPDQSEIFPSKNEIPRLVQLSRDRNFSSQIHELINDCDVLHIHTPWWLKNPFMVKTANLLQKTVVISSHGMLNDWSLRQKRWKKWIYRKLIADRMFGQCVLHCTAEEELRQVLKRIVFRSVEVIPLILDSCYFEGDLNPLPAQSKWQSLTANGTMKLLFLGRVHPVKSPEIAIGVLSHLANSTLMIAGTGDALYIESLKRLAERLGVADRVHWLGMVTGQLKNSLLANCDFMILPTQQENFGLSQVEALGSGLRLITTKGTNNWQELERCGGTVVERSVPAFVDAIARGQLDATSKRDRLDNQRKYLMDWIGPKKITSEYVKMYQRHSSTDSVSS